MGREYVREITAKGSLGKSTGILLFDDGEGTDVWEEEGTGADFVVDTDTSACYSASNGLRLKTRATNPAENDYVTATRKIVTPPSKLILAECKIRLPDVSNVKYLNFDLSYADLDEVITAGFMLDVANEKSKFYNSAGSYAEHSFGATVLYYDNYWYLVRMGIDFSGRTYKDCSINMLSGDESANALNVVAVAAGFGGYFSFTLLAAGAAIAEAHVDDIVISEIA